MKTAEEILFKTTNGNADYISVVNCLEAMKLYANIKLDEAAEVATCDDVAMTAMPEYAVNKESILSLKDKI